MLWLVSILGAVAGFIVASIPGALLGGLLGHLVDRKLALKSWRDARRLFTQSAPTSQAHLGFYLLGRVAKSGGTVSAAHIACARRLMRSKGLDAAAQRAAILAFNQGKEGLLALRRPLMQLRTEPELGALLLRDCWQMARADGEPKAQTLELIMLWGRWLGYSALQVKAFDRVQAPASSQAVTQSLSEAWQLLGLAPGSDAQTLKQAYRRQLSRNHPDKLAGRGASAEQIRQATDKTAALHRAYQQLRQHAEH